MKATDTTDVKNPAPVTAADLLKKEHPLHAAFIAWTQKQGKDATKRQGRRFLQKYPNYRGEAA